MGFLSISILCILLCFFNGGGIFFAILIFIGWCIFQLREINVRCGGCWDSGMTVEEEREMRRKIEEYNRKKQMYTTVFWNKVDTKLLNIEINHIFFTEGGFYDNYEAVRDIGHKYCNGDEFTRAMIELEPQFLPYSSKAGHRMYDHTKAGKELMVKRMIERATKDGLLPPKESEQDEEKIGTSVASS